MDIVKSCDNCRENKNACSFCGQMNECWEYDFKHWQSNYQTLESQLQQRDQVIKYILEALRGCVVELNCLIDQINGGTMRKGSRCRPEGSVCLARDRGKIALELAIGKKSKE